MLVVVIAPLHCNIYTDIFNIIYIVLTISYAGDGVSWSSIGTLTTSQKGGITMVLALNGDEAYQQHVVVHEFGHALGLGHEHQMKHIADGLNERETVKWLMESCELTEMKAKEKFQADYKQCSYKCITDEGLEFDPGSIMCYP